MTIYESAIVAPLAAKGSAISAADFGMNIVLGYERFGDKPWEKFDEIQAAVGSQAVRYPGGTMSEQLFDKAYPLDAGVATSCEAQPPGRRRTFVAGTCE